MTTEVSGTIPAALENVLTHMKDKKKITMLVIFELLKGLSTRDYDLPDIQL